MSGLRRLFHDVQFILETVSTVAQNLAEMIGERLDASKAKESFTPLPRPGPSTDLESRRGTGSPSVDPRSISFFQKHGYWPDSVEDLENWIGRGFDE